MEHKQLPFVIKATWLLRIYFIIPVLVGVLLLDIVGYQQTLVFPHMGLESLLLPVYLLVFELPHIVGSFLSFADVEYLRHYRTKLVMTLPLILGAIGALLFVNLLLAVAVYLVATMYHVIKQQTGVGLLLGVPRNRWFVWWSWSGILMTSMLLIFFSVSSLFPAHTLPLINSSVALLLIAFIVCGLVLLVGSTSRVAKRYVALATLSLVVAYVFINMGYLFLGFFLVRFIHDITAFCFYIAHETNRNRDTLHNMLYRLLRHIPVPIFVLVPVLSIAIAYLIRTSRAGVTTEEMLYVIVILFGFTHYYLESMIWKKDALHRQEIHVQT